MLQIGKHMTMSFDNVISAAHLNHVVTALRCICVL